MNRTAQTVHIPSTRPFRRPRAALLALAGASLLGFGVATPGQARAQAPEEVVTPTPEQRLAGRYERYARQILERAGARPALEAFELSLLPATTATRLDPTDVELWRTRLAIADLAEQDDVVLECLDVIARLDPADDVIRLRRLNLALGRLHTAEGQRDAYLRLLAEENRAALGPAVASRLAYDLALLQLRLGDNEGYGTWLAEAVALDPCNRVATAEAAGYFQANVNDPFAQAELLTTAVLADPTDLTTQRLLGGLLLEHGAYTGAATMFASVAESTRQNSRLASVVRGIPVDLLVPADLLVDLAIAKWGQQDLQGVIDLINHRFRLIERERRESLLAQNPDMTEEELNQGVAQLAPGLAVVRAALFSRLGPEHADAAKAAALEAFASYEGKIRAATAEQPDNIELQLELLLESAWVAIWLGGRPEGVARVVEEVEKLRPLRPEAKARFEGWIALRTGDLERAAAQLAPIAERDTQARLGLALVHLEQGRTREGARGLYAVARAEPGTIMGIWSASYLSELLGQPVEPVDPAPQMNKLITSIPRVFFRFAEDPTQALGMRLRPRHRVTQAYSPIWLDVEITNNSPFPLAIDRAGPIRPHVALILTARVAEVPSVNELAPVIVDIGRRLRLEPGERLIVPIDLRKTVLSDVLEQHRLRGATLRVRGTINFRTIGSAERRAIVTDLLGSDAESSVFRVDGVRATTDWVDAALADVQTVDSDSDLETVASLAMLMQTTSPLADHPAWAELLTGLTDGVVAAWPQIDTAGQSWLLTVIPKGEALKPIIEQARRSTEPSVQMAFLLYCLQGKQDPMLAAALRGNDLQVRATAEMMVRLIDKAEAQGRLTSGTDEP